MLRLSDHTYDEAQEIMLINKFQQEDVDDIFEAMSRMMMRLHVWAVGNKPTFCTPEFLKDPKYVYQQKLKKERARIVQTQCEGKFGFDKRSVAAEVLSRMRNYDRGLSSKRSKMEDSVQVYQCASCHKFHIGSSYKLRSDYRNRDAAVA